MLAAFGLFSMVQVVRILAAVFETRARGAESGLCVPFGIDLNEASVAQLQSLPGVGESRAAAIVLHRVRHGPFRNIDDLDAVEGFGAALVAQVKPFVLDPRRAR